MSIDHSQFADFGPADRLYYQSAESPTTSPIKKIKAWHILLFVVGAGVLTFIAYKTAKKEIEKKNSKNN